MIRLDWSLGPAEDPSPDAPLKSDITFGIWLAGLDVAQVLIDLERTFEGNDRLRLQYLRRSFERQQQGPL